MLGLRLYDNAWVNEELCSMPCAHCLVKGHVLTRVRSTPYLCIERNTRSSCSTGPCEAVVAASHSRRQTIEAETPESRLDRNWGSRCWDAPLKLRDARLFGLRGC